ncbi:glycosyltransferase [Paracandidimonas lactea]|uniref:glycosyltransferase n=1 Tax=Paracandidimonas lactea TaxID=2895524 RepID=UPI001F380D01|nr:glycosyltransferase [Paracandidimonas lactea]
MARIAYVDHSFHRQTLSTGFLLDILQRNGHIVDYFWDDGWMGGQRVQWDSVKNYDVVIMFQAFCPIDKRYYRTLHPNVIFIPMLDQFGVWQGPLFNLRDFWEPFQGSKILSFSNAVHGMVMGFGIKSHFLRYYQSIPKNCAIPTSGLHGFFWLRREQEISWVIIRKLISDFKFDSFHIHLANDPGTSNPSLPSPEDISKHNITTSTWFDNKQDFVDVLERANVFFAPRMEEGIGQSFLEAMARGQCVVAPNQGTMNEYIIPGLNGLLYDANNPTALDFSDAIKLGNVAQMGVIQGRRFWERSEAQLVDYILTPSADFYSGKYQHNLNSVRVDRSVMFKLRYLCWRFPILRHARPLWISVKKWKSILIAPKR